MVGFVSEHRAMKVLFPTPVMPIKAIITSSGLEALHVSHCIQGKVAQKRRHQGTVPRLNAVGKEVAEHCEL